MIQPISNIKEATLTVLGPAEELLLLPLSVSVTGWTFLHKRISHSRYAAVSHPYSVQEKDRDELASDLRYSQDRYRSRAYS